MTTNLPRWKQYLLIGMLIVASPVLLPVAAIVTLPLFGYYTDRQDAEEAAIANHDPYECNNYVQPFALFVPPQSEMREGCIYHTARVLQDPRACLPLMPSPFGISCIGQVWGEANPENFCEEFDAKTKVRCRKTVEPGQVVLINDCNEHSLQAAKDACLVLDAGIKGDVSLCSSIENPVLKSVCEVRIELQKKYPDIPELR